MKDSDFHKSLPNKINITDEPTLIKVYTRGKLNEQPKDVMEKYIPEGNSDDIPRSFVSKANLGPKYIYRENAFLPIEHRQRPIVIKHLIQFNLYDNFPIFVIKSRGEISRKLREIKYQVREIKNQEISLTELIILMHESIDPEKIEIDFPMHAFICSFDYKP